MGTGPNFLLGSSKPEQFSFRSRNRSHLEVGAVLILKLEQFSFRNRSSSHLEVLRNKKSLFCDDGTFMVTQNYFDSLAVYLDMFLF